jgi:predicted small integral membrane protein
MRIETTERLTGPARDLQACSYNRQEGFEYLGATVGYISWILRNSHEISA